MHIPNDIREITTEIDEFKSLIEVARADMASHPAFPQESIKYEAFAAESEKGNIYHAVLELTENEGEELIARMKENDDTRIVRYVSLFGDLHCDFGGYELRKKLIELNPDNNGAIMLLTSDKGFTKRTVTETMHKKYVAKDQLEIFEFHDAELELLRYEKSTGELVVSAKYLNILNNTKQNPSDHHMEIKEATIYFNNFTVLSLETSEQYSYNEKNELISVKEGEKLSENEAWEYFFEKLTCGDCFSILGLTKSENEIYIMTANTMTDAFDIRFTFDRVIITWNEYEGWAWYEEYRLSKLKNTEEV